MHRTKTSRHPWVSPEVQAVLAVVLSVLTGGWAADEGRELFDRATGRGGAEAIDLTSYLLGCLGMLSLFVLSLFWLYRLRKVWIHPRTRLRQHVEAPAYPTVVVFLSSLNTDRGYQPGTGLPERFTPTGDLDADLNRLEDLKERCDGLPPVRWPWEMTLRGLRHHLGTLKRVIVFCSEDSLAQAHWLGRLLLRDYGSAFRGVEVKLALWKSGDRLRLTDCPTEAPLVRGPGDSGWDFEDFDGLSRGMTCLLDDLTAEGVRPNQVVIDFTSGQKPNSVVGASVTYNRDTVCQYVRTTAPYRVIQYDLVLTPMEDEGI